MADTFDELVKRYETAFGEPPLTAFGVDDDTMIELMQEALEKGRPIPEEDYYRDLPRGAVA